MYDTYFIALLLFVSRKRRISKLRFRKTTLWYRNPRKYCGYTVGSKRSISKTFAHPLGSGRKADEDDISMNDNIYNYNENQLFASSDRITFNARKESMFLAARDHIHIGCGSSMTFSTSDNIFSQAARSVVTNTPLFKVNSDTVYIDGRTKVVLGNPLLNDNIQKAVVGN